MAVFIVIKSKKRLSLFIFFAALVAVGISLYPTINCLNELQKDLVSETPSHPKVIALKDSLESLPSDNSALTNLVLPLCREEEPMSNVTIWLALAGVLCVAGFIPLLGKEKEKVQKEIMDPERLRRRTMQTGAIKTTLAPVAISADFEITAEEEEGMVQDSDASSLMTLVEKQRKATPAPRVRKDSASGLDPHEGRMVFFVDPEMLTNSATRFRDLEEALNAAQKKCVEMANSNAGINHGIQIRLAPGVYQLSIKIPPNIVIVNHKMPQFKNLRKGLLWVSKQELDNPNRVTLLADPNKSYGVKILRGNRQGIFGCHIIGRGKENQKGILVEQSESAEIINCVVEGFSGGGIRMENSGSGLPNIMIHIGGSMIRNNSAKQGGGVYAVNSSALIQTSIIRDNVAKQGGGLFVADTKSTFEMEEVRFEKNLAKSEKKVANPDWPLEKWTEKSGVGGALFIINSKIKMLDLECIENLAFSAGGGLALISSKIVIRNQKFESRIERNRSLLGGGLFLVGHHKNTTLVKFESGKLKNNHVKEWGGGACVIGNSVLQLSACHTQDNRSSVSGGGVSCHLGASLDVNGGVLKNNHALKNGGAIASINGRIRLREKLELVENVAQASGGALFAISAPGQTSEQLIRRKELQIPLKILIEDVIIRHNQCGQVGGGLRFGNLIKEASIPMEISINGKASIRSNENEKGIENNIFASWAGQILTDDVQAYRKKRLE